jgi:hypothetical protein
MMIKTLAAAALRASSLLPPALARCQPSHAHTLRRRAPPHRTSPRRAAAKGGVGCSLHKKLRRRAPTATTRCASAVSRSLAIVRSSADTLLAGPARSVGTASAECVADCTAKMTSMTAGCPIDAAAAVAGTAQECPSGCQALIDDVYSTCDCADDWETAKPGVKIVATAYGCGGAAQAAPLFAAMAMVANHFLN